MEFSSGFLQSFGAFCVQCFFGQPTYGWRIRSLQSTVVCDLFVNAGLGSATRDKCTCHRLGLFKVLLLLCLASWPDIWNKLIS